MENIDQSIHELLDAYQAELSPRQAELYGLINDHWRAHCCSPTVRELQEAMGLNSGNGIHDHLKALHRKGWISKASGRSRHIITKDVAKLLINL